VNAAASRGPRRGHDSHELARALRELGVRLEMEGVLFKPQAFERATRAPEARRGSAAELGGRLGLRGQGPVPGVGRGIAERTRPQGRRPR
jgi:DNA polymerase/3'-5' exonuclease PolX